MRAVIDAQRHCFAATVTRDGQPNLSPKGTIRVWDDDHRRDEIHRSAAERIAREEGAGYPVEAVVLIAVERALPVVSPGHAHVEDETVMRGLYRARREERDAAFERHIARRDPWPGAKGGGRAP